MKETPLPDIRQVVSLNLAMPVPAGLIFRYCGFFPERAGPDGFAGIRTPLILISPAAGKKTRVPG